MAGKFITAKHNALFIKNVQALRTVLGKKSTFVVIYPGARQLCGNCVWDPVHECSSGQYNGTGPFPFARVCPVCKGVGNLTKPQQRTIPDAIVTWSKSLKGSLETPLAAGELPYGNARIQVDIQYLALLKTATAYLVDTIRCSHTSRVDEGNTTGLLSKASIIFTVKRDD